MKLYDPRTVSLPDLRQRLMEDANQRRHEAQQQNASDEALHRQFDDFVRTHLDFVATPNNLKSLAAEIGFGNARELLAGTITTDHFHGAHAMNAYQSVYESAPAPTPETMSMADLRAQVLGESAPDPMYAMPMSELRQR